MQIKYSKLNKIYKFYIDTPYTYLIPYDLCGNDNNDAYKVEVFYDNQDLINTWMSFSENIN